MIGQRQLAQVGDDAHRVCVERPQCRGTSLVVAVPDARHRRLVGRQLSRLVRRPLAVRGAQRPRGLPSALRSPRDAAAAARARCAIGSADCGRRACHRRRTVDAHAGVARALRRRSDDPRWLGLGARQGDWPAHRRFAPLRPDWGWDRRRAGRDEGHRADRRPRSDGGRFLQISRRDAHGRVRDRPPHPHHRDECGGHRRWLSGRGDARPDFAAVCTSRAPSR